MSKRTSSARPSNHFVSRPTCHLVSIPKGVGAGRGGSSSASGNGDWFVDDQRDISEYINKGNRHVVRPRGIHGGRIGRSNGSGNGDPFANDLVDIGQDIDEGNKDAVRWRGIHRGRCGSSSAIGEGDRIADDYVEDVEEGIDEIYMEYPYRGTCSPTNNFYLQVSSLEVYQCFHTKKGSVSEYITTGNSVYTNNSYAHQSSVASSEVVVNLKQQLEDQENVSHELEIAAKERQDAPDEWEREAEQRVKVLKEQVKEISNRLKTLIMNIEGSKKKKLRTRSKNGPLKVDHGTDAMTVVLGREKEVMQKEWEVEVSSVWGINPIDPALIDEEGAEQQDDTKGEDHKTEQEPKGDDQAKEAENEPFHEVKVSFIPELTQQPPSTPPLPATEDPAALVINFEAIDSFLNKFHAYENDVHELKQADPSASILESIRSQVPSIVKDSLGSNIGDELQKGKETKKRRSGKEAESSKKSLIPKESTKGKPPSKSSKTSKYAPADQLVKEPEHECSTCKSCVELEYNMEKFFCALSDQLDWTNPEGYDRPIDMSKPLPLQEKEGRLIIPIEVLFNNNLDYLKGDKAKRTYSSSITKTPTSRYTMEWIEDLIPNLWSPILIDYDKDAALGIKNWRPQRQ
ncbi:hypothetical protein Tco_0232586 [Tanacetum coccineum]